MKNFVLLILLMLVPLTSHGAQSEGWFFDPHAAVGYNPSQGTHFRFGLDLGKRFNENVSGGIGAFYSMGENPADDREIGAGPFVSYVQPITSFLMASARQEVDYIDMNVPVAVGTTYTHTNETGVASVTSAALHMYFGDHFVLSGGYRLVVGLTNEKLDDERSGAFVGFAFGI